MLEQYKILNKLSSFDGIDFNVCCDAISATPKMKEVDGKIVGGTEVNGAYKPNVFGYAYILSPINSTLERKLLHFLPAP